MYEIFEIFEFSCQKYLQIFQFEHFDQRKKNSKVWHRNLNWLFFKYFHQLEFSNTVTSRIITKTCVYFSREIASAIKKLLDAVNEVSAYIPGTSGKQALDQKKREFVKYSKRFSNTLKEFFRDGQ